MSGNIFLYSDLQQLQADQRSGQSAHVASLRRCWCCVDAVHPGGSRSGFCCRIGSHPWLWGFTGFIAWPILASLSSSDSSMKSSAATSSLTTVLLISHSLEITPKS
eukprot:GFUD01128721.1.p1 GENE.GFUD01128721.1~~GFUD01128721.1.p1  ORF type:complete len:106 (+),score=8.64 GFUD01128721.1:19-336(+)